MGSVVGFHHAKTHLAETKEEQFRPRILDVAQTVPHHLKRKTGKGNENSEFRASGREANDEVCGYV